MSTTQSFRERNLIAAIGDEDSVTGLLLAGIGNVDPVSKASNFLVVDKNTTLDQIIASFQQFCKRKDIAIILINQYLANEIRDQVAEQQKMAFPVIVEIPSKDYPYDPAQDSVLIKIQKMFGNE
ncbi:hypothetical protein MP228_002362 [Amoeboaphelidium protococcarum]|nr:hypothetical protein MP228_002362 [Amoeboaphelidium protococcarum]